jgi:hypothetical protein
MLHKHLAEILRQVFINAETLLTRVRQVFNKRNPDQFPDCAISMHVRTLDEIDQPKPDGFLGQSQAGLAEQTYRPSDDVCEENVGEELFIEIHMLGMQALKLRKILEEAMKELLFVHLYQFPARADLRSASRLLATIKSRGSPSL